MRCEIAFLVAVSACLIVGCPKKVPEPLPISVRPPIPDHHPPPNVDLDDLMEERDPKAEKLKAWNLQLERKQKMLEDLRREITNREKALGVVSDGWTEGKISKVVVDHQAGITTVKLDVDLEGDKGTIVVQAPYDVIRDFCGSPDLHRMISLDVWYADKQISSEKPSGLLDINLVERIQ
jgi:hypothetical protein